MIFHAPPDVTLPPDPLSPCNVPLLSDASEITPLEVDTLIETEFTSTPLTFGKIPLAVVEEVIAEFIAPL